MEVESGIFVPAKVLRDDRLSANDKIVYCVCKYLSFEGKCWASYLQMACICGISRNVISKSVERLEQCGYISVCSINAKSHKITLAEGVRE